jgi:hypothetical protein
LYQLLDAVIQLETVQQEDTAEEATQEPVEEME